MCLMEYIKKGDPLRSVSKGAKCRPNRLVQGAWVRRPPHTDHSVAVQLPACAPNTTQLQTRTIDRLRLQQTVDQVQDVHAEMWLEPVHHGKKKDLIMAKGGQVKCGN